VVVEDGRRNVRCVGNGSVSALRRKSVRDDNIELEASSFLKK